MIWIGRIRRTLRLAGMVLKAVRLAIDAVQVAQLGYRAVLLVA